MRGFDFRAADIGAGVAVAYALRIEFAEDEEEVEEIRTTLRHRPTTLTSTVETTAIEGDEIVPTMVPSWWGGDDEAFAEAKSAAAFFQQMPKGGAG